MKTTRPTWVFDDSPIEDTFGYGERAVRFIRALKHPATGQKFQLDRPWERIVRRIYGPCKPDGTRIVRNVVIQLSRGGRKTTHGAAFALLHTIGPEKVPRGQVVLAAYDREQARIAYDEALGIVMQDPRLKKVTKLLDSRHQIRSLTSGAVLQAVSADANAQNGRTVRFVLHDELHAHRSRKLYDVLRTSLSKSPNTLSVTISQAGRGTKGGIAEIFDYARKVARGEINDPGTLPILFETDPSADWRDEAVWHEANPGLAFGYPDIVSLRQEAREAEHSPALREKFRNDHLGIWLDSAHDPFVDLRLFDAGAIALDKETLAALADRPCFIGCDLSRVNDLTALVACWPDDKGGFTVKPWFYCPKDALRERSDRDGVPYTYWAEQGYILPTPGKVVDFSYIEQRIRDLAKQFRVSEIVFDMKDATGIMQRLMNSGLPAYGFGQGFYSMAPAVSSLERAIVGGNFKHDGNPVLRWNFENAVLMTDAAGNQKFTKDGSRERIDGVVATAMALSRASRDDSPSFIYADERKRPGGIIGFEGGW